MGLDIYVGCLTRYYAHDWKTVTQQFAEARGIQFRVVRDADPRDAVTNKKQIRQAVLQWRSTMERALGNRLRGKLDWDESDRAPYFTEKPDFDGWHALQLLAASAAAGQGLPDQLPTDWTKDPRWANAMQQTPFRHIVDPHVWLPADFDDVFVAETVAGPPVPFGSSVRFLEQVRELNKQTFDGTEEDYAHWRSQGPGDVTAQKARFGLAVFVEHAVKSVTERLPMLLDY